MNISRLGSTICFLVFSICVAGYGGPARAQNGDGIVVLEAWAKASLAGTKNGAAYVTVVNKGGPDDLIVGVESPVADAVELHAHIMEGEVMKMRSLKAVDLPTDATAKMGPGGLHVMLIGLRAPLEEGSSFPLTLILEKGGRVEAEVMVMAPNATGGGHDKMKMQSE